MKLLVGLLTVAIVVVPGCSSGPSAPNVPLRAISALTPVKTGDWIWPANPRSDWPETRMRTFVYQIPRPSADVYKEVKEDLSDKSKFALIVDHSSAKEMNFIDFSSIDPATKQRAFGPGVYVLVSAGKCRDPKSGVFEPGTRETWTSIQINVPFSN